MKYKVLTKEDTSILKGIGILCIIMHNFFHWGQPLTGKENEFLFNPDNIFCFFRAFAEYPADSFNIFFSYLGHFGVQLFIFISGYGLAKSMLNKPQKYLPFIADRLKKIYPLIIIAYIFHFMFAIIAYGHVLEWKENMSFIYKFLFVHTLVPNEALSLNGPLWFLGFIFQMYLIFPLLFKAIQKYRAKAFAAIGIISYTIVYSCLYVDILPQGISVMQNFPGHLPEFALGILFATSNKKINKWILLIISIIVFCAGNFYKVAYPLTFISLTYIIICLYMLVSREKHTNIASKSLIFMGNLSMVIFATHSQLRWPFVSLAINASNPWYTIAMLLLFLTSAIIVALAAKIMYQRMIDLLSKIKPADKSNIIPVICIIALFSTGCDQTNNEGLYPQSKIWAHRVNDTATAREKSKMFDGLELDAIYSEHQDKIFVGHNIEDTANNLQIDEWFMHIDNPSQKCFWIDMKNLDKHNAKAISEKISCIMDKHNMKDNVFVESPDVNALKTIKKHGLHVILWTENPVWNNIDTATWIEHTRTKINELCPDAISNEAKMYELLTGNFPEQNIHLWQTPTILNEENIEITRKLCRTKPVKVVLVDYNEPIDY